MSVAASPGFSHEALFYAGPQDFTERCTAFIREGLAAGEPVLVMVTGDKIDALRDALGEDADRVTFDDMAEAGRNPGRIISRWSDFATGRTEGRVRGIGEPIWAGRSSSELVECQQHEALINTAFQDVPGFRLACPYDTESLPGDVLDEARRNHPLLLDGEDRRRSEAYVPDGAAAYHRAPLQPPDAHTLEVAFDVQTLDALRRFLRARADEAGLPEERTEDLLMAVNESATNSVRYGGGGGVARVWQSDGALVCEVRDGGLIDSPAAGRVRPQHAVEGGHGLWLAHQLCDLVQIRSTRRGSVVRLHMRT